MHSRRKPRRVRILKSRRRKPGETEDQVDWDDVDLDAIAAGPGLFADEVDK